MPFTVVEFVVAADVFEDEADVFEEAAEEVFAEDEAEDVFADDAADEADVFEDEADEAACDVADEAAFEVSDEAEAALEAACETGSEAFELFDSDFPAQPVRARVKTAAAQSMEAIILFDLLIIFSFLSQRTKSIIHS